MNARRDPPRLVESEPTSVLGKALASAVNDLPSESDLMKLSARLEPVLGPPVRPLRSPVLVKLGLVASVAVLVSGSILFVRHRGAAPAARASAVIPVATTPSVAPPAPSAAPVPAPESSSEAAPGAAISAARETAPAAPASVRRTPRDTNPSEAELLERARQALASDPAAALALTQRDGSLYPNGALAQEREVIAIEALRRLHRDADAEQRASAFGKSFPGSAHQRTVDGAQPK